MQRIAPYPPPGIIVIRCVSLLLKFDKGGSDLVHKRREFKFGTRNESSLDQTLTFAPLPFGSSFHSSVIEESRKLIPLVNTLPVERSFGDQEVEKRIIRRRNRSSQARLFWPCALAASKMACLLKQVV